MARGLTSLQSLTQQSASYTKAVIQAGLRTPQGEEAVWIVVEDIDDVRVYKRFFTENVTRILTSKNKEGQRGCSYVEEIVSEILAEEDDPLIFGIRDTDYTRYETPQHIFPPAIFTTDYRDVEMMMLSAPSVMDDLKAWNPDLCLKLREGEPLVRMMGYIRLCNHLYSLGCNFKRKVKISKLWDDTSHSFVSDWEVALITLFLQNYNNNPSNPHTPFTEEKLRHTIEYLVLENENSLYICQGHDTVKLLQYMMVHTQVNQYNEASIMSRMTNAYSLADFKNTRLYNQIKGWASSKGVVIIA